MHHMISSFLQWNVLGAQLIMTHWVAFGKTKWGHSNIDFVLLDTSPFVALKIREKWIFLSSSCLFYSNIVYVIFLFFREREESQGVRDGRVRIWWHCYFCQWDIPSSQCLWSRRFQLNVLPSLWFPLPHQPQSARQGNTWSCSVLQTRPSGFSIPHPCAKRRGKVAWYRVVQ